MKSRSDHGSWKRTSTRPILSDSTDEEEMKSYKFSCFFGTPSSSLIYDSVSITLSYCVDTGTMKQSRTRPESMDDNIKLSIPNFGGSSLPVIDLVPFAQSASALLRAVQPGH